MKNFEILFYFAHKRSDKNCNYYIYSDIWGGKITNCKAQIQSSLPNAIVCQNSNHYPAKTTH